jgi:hypothetical protein
VANVSGDFSVTSGLIVGDDVAANIASATATFADKRAGTNKAVSVSGVVLSGADKDNYSVVATAGSATIFKKVIDVRGLTPDSKVYDGTRSATVSGTPDITSSFVAGDNVALNVGNFTVEFGNKNVGTAKPLYVTGNLLTGMDAVNYDALLNTTANITARPLTVTATALDKTYDGTTVASVNFNDNRITGDALSLAGVGAFADKKAGAGKSVSINGISLTGADVSNYSYATTDLSATASINPKTILATGTRVYDGSTAMPASTFGFDGVVTGDVLALSGSVALLDKRVGANKTMNGTLLLEGADSQNYILSGMQYAVTPKALTVSGLTATSKVYDGTTAASAAGTPAIGLELVVGDVVTADLSTIHVAFLNKNVGSAKALQVTGNVLIGTDAANYQPILSATADITPKQLTITGVGADNKVYDGTTTATRLTTGTPLLAGGIVTGDDFSVNLANLAVAFADKNAGTGKTLVVAGASMTGVDAGNYLVSVQNATADITPKTLTASIAAPNKVYDGSTSASPTLSITAGLVGSEIVSASGTASFNSKDVLSANLVTVNSTALTDGGSGSTSGLASNYQLAAGQTVAASITSQTLTARVTAPNKVYDANATASPTLSITAGLIGSETVSATGTASFNSQDVLSANLVTVNSTLLIDGGNGGLASNYQLAAGQTVAASITPQTLTASVTAPNKVYDANATASPTLSITAGLVGSETVSATGTASFNSKDVLSANLVTVNSAILIDGSNGGQASNYQITSGQTVAARITPQTLTASVTAPNKVYDASALAAPTLVLNGLIGSETVSAIGTASFNSKDVLTANHVTVNSISLVDGGSGNTAGLASNYQLVAGQTAVAHITPAPLTATVSAPDKVYDGSIRANPTLNISSGLVGSETVTATGTGSFNSKDVLSANLLTISDVTLSDGGSGSSAGLASNYSLASGQTVAARITPAALTASVSLPGKIYDGSTSVTPVLSITSGLVGSETVNVAGAGSFNNKDVLSANLLTISSVTLSDGGSGSSAGLASNYSLASGQTIAASITPASLTITSEDKARVYGDANPDLTTTLTGFVAGETLATSGVTGSGSSVVNATQTSPQGNYTITPTLGSLRAQNYAFQAFVNGNLFVTARPLSVTANNVVRLAGEPDPKPLTFSAGQGGSGLGGLVNGDSLASVSIATPVGSTGATGGEILNLVPSAATFATGLASNYDIKYVDGYLIVVPQPADLAKDNKDITNPAFFLEINPEEIAMVRTELDHQQTQLLMPPVPVALPFKQGLNNNLAIVDRDPDEVRRVVQQFGRAAQLDSAALLNTMRSEPLVSWHPALPPQLLQLIGRDAQ